MAANVNSVRNFAIHPGEASGFASKGSLGFLEDARQGGVINTSILAQSLAKQPAAARQQILSDIAPYLADQDRVSLNKDLEAATAHDEGAACRAPVKSMSEDVASKSYIIDVEGSMENDLLGSGCLYIKEDGEIIDSIKMNAGGFGSGAPENGNYTVEGYRNRRLNSGDYNKGMNRDGVGFSFNLNPNFETLRSLQRIHPDGNKPGTLGCVGLVGEKDDLLEFEANVKKILSVHDSIGANIQIDGNPNHSTPPAKPSKVKE